MKPAISNIALPSFDHQAALADLAALGVVGLEVAPSRVWPDVGRVGPTQVAAYRRAIESAGLSAVGLHSLFFGQAELGLFKGPDSFDATVDFMLHLSAICRDLGGRTLIYGGGRRRGDVSLDAAMAECDAFLDRVLPAMEAHGTVLCFEPLGPKDTDFLNTAAENAALADAVNHPALALQLDAKALAANDEMTEQTIRRALPRLVHVHANQPDLGILDPDGQVDHQAFAGFLRTAGYDGYVSIEQKMLSKATWYDDCFRSLTVLQRFYHVRACDGVDEWH